MNLLAIGTDDQVGELRQKFGDAHTIRSIERSQEIGSHLASTDAVFDFAGPRDLSGLSGYPKATTVSVLFDTSVVPLARVLEAAPHLAHDAYGFCGLRTFVKRDILEVTMPRNGDRERLDRLCGQLKTQYRVVADQAGMVSPRVLCMIINEAFITLEEGTATREDIDLAMKLGTNYPFGPFEWADRIGLSNVVGILTAVQRETNDDRYRCSSLLIELSGRAKV